MTSRTNGKDDNLSSIHQDGEMHDLVLRTFRCLVADLCQNFHSGHPGGAMSMAAMGIALYKYVMRYSPTNPGYFNRDRVVLSNGHACLWQYIFMHWVGFPGMTLEELKSYRSPRIDGLCPGHSQIQLEGHEVTTGPLGQGVANAVGLAAAAKHLGAVYNRPGFELVDNMTWCTIGDACIQEGVALEAIQLAGHWRLNNLAILYDHNDVTCDGTLDVTCTEDINAKMIACGYNVIDVFDGVSNVDGIVRALTEARRAKDKPTFINIRTVIAFGSSKEGRAESHGAPLGEESVAGLKRRFGMNPDELFRIDSDVYEYFEDIALRGKQLEVEFEEKLQGYAQAYPELAKEFNLRMQGQMTDDWQKYIPSRDAFPKDKFPTREAVALIIAVLAKNINTFLVGTANLGLVVDFTWKEHVAFQSPDLETTCGIRGDYTGRYIHYGIREHAMASVSNGFAAYNPGTILPVTSAFFMFYLYAAPGVRMGALQGLQAIHIATHDNIAPGYDGPAHQPIEVAALFRSMPNLLYIRPCDSEETCGAFEVALNARTTPTVLSLSRHPLLQFPGRSSREGTRKGAYVLIEDEDADVTFIGVGSEMTYAVDATDKLREENISARVVSFPCQRLFDMQSPEYKESVMQYKKKKPIVVIEAYAVNGWERYADAGYSMNSFGKSLPENLPIYQFFNFDAGKIAAKVKLLVEETRDAGIESLRGNFRELNGGPMGYGWNPL
ncbi:putative dihydroxy-acetone synthase [Nemania sp. FL0031]|nr:putative dihydroxy-acetone synthase [Nemania sp. FL0031]